MQNDNTTAISSKDIQTIITLANHQMETLDFT
jgi:hypothetical protein